MAEIQQIQDAQNSNIGQATEYNTIMKLLKMVIGTGVFALPYAYMKIGLIFGIPLQFLIFLFQYKSWCNLMLFMDIKDKTDTLNKQMRSLSLVEWVAKHVGVYSPLAIFTNMNTVFLNFGGVVSCFILFLNMITRTFNNNDISFKIFVGFWLYLLHFFSSFLKQFDRILPFMIISVYIMYFCMCWFIGLAVEQNQINIVQVDYKSMMICYGIMIFAYDCNGTITEIRQEMKDKSKFSKVLFISMTIETLIYFGFGITCTLTFGDQTKQIVLDNFINLSKYDIVNHITQVTIITYTTSILVNSLGMNLPNFRVIKIQFQITSRFLEIILNSIQIVSQLVIAIIMPQFAIVLAVIGCIGTVSLGFIVPFILSQMVANDKSQLENYSLLVFGLIGAAAGLLATFYL